MKSVKLNPLTSLVVAAALAIGLAACGGSSTTTDPMPTTPSEPTAEQRAAEQMTLITSASEGLKTDLMGLDTAAPTLEQIGAVDAAIRLLEDALDGAVDLSPNQTVAARNQLSAAKTTVATARTTHADALGLAGKRKDQMDAITDAQTALETALDALMADDADSIAAVNGAITALQGAVDAAEDLTDAEKMDAMSDLKDAEVSAANAELDMYKAAAMAEGASNEDMLAAYEGKLKAATRLVAALTANDGSAADIAEANRIIGSATTMVANLKEKIQMAKGAETNKTRLANNAVSMKVAEAINAHMVMGETRTGSKKLPDAFKDTTGGAWAISRTSGAAKIKLNQAAPVAEKDKYAVAAGGSVNGYAGGSYSRDSMSGKRPVTEMAAVYTDIAMSTDQAWEDFFGGDAADDTGLVTLASRTTDTVERFFSGIIPAAPTGSDQANTRTIAAVTKTTVTRIPGTYFGVAGTYVCPATTLCTVARNRSDVVTVVGLTFAPTVTATDTLTGATATVKAKYVAADTAYTHFGYWMRSVTQRDGTKEHGIETFSGGMGALAGGTGNEDLSTVTGTAEYFGAAAGVYVKKDGAGDSLIVTDGTFTADAMLTAKFGGDAIAVNDQFMVSGSISDFMDVSTDLGFADLSLNDAAIADTSADGTVGSFSGETDGGGTSGNWSGMFFGNVGGSTTVTTDDFPADVSGEFNGHFTNGHVAGAFGAEYDQ
ncbi:MAG: hypothetical protein F4169_11375 [Gammaproteobacteria bacterium]|nr:hypothetical protein [Gammaproteobacteria bacterium]